MKIRLGLPVVYAALFAFSFSVSGLALSAKAISSEAYMHYQKAVQLEKIHNFREAEREYQTALALDPYDSLTYIRLAYLVERDDRRDQALQLYQKALELNPKDSMIHLAMARILESKHQPQQALDQYKHLLVDMPDYTYAYLPMARLERSLKQNADAIADYQQFLKVYPKHYDAQRELASLQLSDKQYAQAASSYKSLQEAHPTQFKDNLAYGVALNDSGKAQDALTALDNVQTPSATLWEQKARAYEKLNQLPEAYQAYLQAVKLDPQGKNDLNLQAADIAMGLKQTDNAIAALKAYLVQDPKNAHVSKSLADLEVQQNDYASAEALYQDSLKDVPDTEKDFQAQILKGIGYSAQMQNKPEEAISAYEKALTLQDDVQTRSNLAILYHQQKQYAKAVELYRQLLAVNPQSPELRKDMGDALLALGDQAYQSKNYNAALANYQDALLLGGASEESVLLGIANTQYAQKNTALAYTGYQRILEKDPENITALINKAQIDLQEKNYMAALQGLRKVVEKRPDSLDAYRLLAETHEGLGDYGQASLYYQKALELQPKNTTLLIRSGNVWRLMGNLDKAQQAYELAKANDPGDAVLHYNLGSVYNMKNKLDASLQEYKTALQLNPRLIESYYGMGNTLEKEKKPTDALLTYQQYLQKAPPSASYVALAKTRVAALSKVLKAKPAAKTASTPKPDVKLIGASKPILPAATATPVSPKPKTLPPKSPAVKVTPPTAAKPPESNVPLGAE